MAGTERTHRRVVTSEKLVGVGPVRDHVVEMLATGMSRSEIARQAQVSKATVSTVENGLHPRVRASVSGRLLALPVPETSTAPEGGIKTRADFLMVSAHPVREHVLQLRRAGIFVSTIVAETGISKSVVDRLLADKVAQMRASTATALMAVRPGSDDTGSMWTDPQAAREHVARLRQAGMSYGAIADQAGVGGDVVSRVEQGRARKISRVTEQKLLAAVLRVAENAKGPMGPRGPMKLVDPAAALARIDQLYSTGLSVNEIARYAGVGKSSVQRIVSRRTRRVTAETVRRLLTVDVPLGGARARVDLTEVREHIARLRSDGATISEVAQKLGVSRCTVEEIASGRRKQIRARVAERLRVALVPQPAMSDRP